MLSKTELQENLHTTIIGKKLFLFDSIDSTNTCAKALAETNCEEGTVVIAEMQTAGRGRLGRTWSSDSGKNLLFSILLRPAISIEQSGLLSLLAAVATSSAIESVLGIKTFCKWPNDLLFEGKKCCGILLESSITAKTFQYAIVGIGLNVNQPQFPDELNARATSLIAASGNSINRTMLLKSILEYFDRYYIMLLKNDTDTIVKDWRNRSTMLGKSITFIQENNTITGIARDITNDGGLILETPTGTNVFYAGEVTLSSTQV